MERVPLQDILESIRRELENLKATESESSIYADVAIADSRVMNECGPVLSWTTEWPPDNGAALIDEAPKPKPSPVEAQLRVRASAAGPSRTRRRGCSASPWVVRPQPGDRGPGPASARREASLAAMRAINARSRWR
jgi:hypothetical protein